MSRISKHDATIATLAYGDVFDYSLTRQGVSRWFLFYPVTGLRIPENPGFSIARREAPRQIRKWKIAERAGRWLSLIPTIHMVGVTGGLAMNNAGVEDDIDLFFIVAGGTLWVTRMLATILMDILGLRRHPEDRRVADKVCLNMFMTERATALPTSDRDCFTAHEVLQMVPIWEQPGTYKRFLFTNRWAQRYLPNAWKEKNQTIVPKTYISFPLVILCMRVFEWSSRYLQLWYMARHRTREVITDTTLRFHPRDARVWVKRKLAARLKKHHIPLDKVFYAS